MIEVLRSESQQHQVLATAIEDQYVLGFSVQQVRITRGWCVSKTHSRRAEAHRTIASMCGMAKAFVTT